MTKLVNEMRRKWINKVRINREKINNREERKIKVTQGK